MYGDHFPVNVFAQNTTSSHWRNNALPQNNLVKLNQFTNLNVSNNS